MFTGTRPKEDPARPPSSDNAVWLLLGQSHHQVGSRARGEVQMGLSEAVQCTTGSWTHPSCGFGLARRARHPDANSLPLGDAIQRN